MKSIKSVVAALTFFVLLPAGTCNQHDIVTPNPPVITDSHECQAACDNLSRLRCEEGEPIDMNRGCTTSQDCTGPNGRPDVRQYCAHGRCMVACVDFCIDTQSQGVWLDPGCVKDIVSCEQVESCPTPGPRQPTCVGPACPDDIRTGR